VLFSESFKWFASKGRRVGFSCLNLITALSGRPLDQHHRRINSKDWMQAGGWFHPVGRKEEAAMLNFYKSP
jgi:hypothetical protein